MLLFSHGGATAEMGWWMDAGIGEFARVDRVRNPEAICRAGQGRMRRGLRYFSPRTAAFCPGNPGPGGVYGETVAPPMLSQTPYFLLLFCVVIFVLAALVARDCDRG